MLCKVCVTKAFEENKPARFSIMYPILCLLEPRKTSDCPVQRVDFEFRKRVRVRLGHNGTVIQLQARGLGSNSPCPPQPGLDASVVQPKGASIFLIS